MKRTNRLFESNGRRYLCRATEGSVLVVTMISVMILLLALGTVLMSMTNKYFTAYQWASWQEALQGAESGADIAMAEMRKDVTQSSSTPWVGWRVGWYQTVNGQKVKNGATEKTVGSDGTYSDNSGSGGGSGHSNPVTLDGLRKTRIFDYLTYGWDPDYRPNDVQLASTSSSQAAHAGEGNNVLKVSVTIDAPTSLVDSTTGTQWLRIRATGTTDVVGPARVSEDKGDNRLRKLGFFLLDLAGNKRKPFSTRKIELVAKPVSMFSGALTAMVQIKNDDQAMVTDSFNSEDTTTWPLIQDPNAPAGSLMYDLTKAHDPTTTLGKNGDIASNAFPIHHDHSENLDLHHSTIWGDVGNNYSQIKNLDMAYYGGTPDPTNFGLNNNNYGTVNPTPTLIKTTNNTNEGGDVSGNIATNYYRDLPPVTEPNWSSGSTSNYIYYSKVDKGTADLDNTSTDPNNPTHVQIGTTSARAGITLAASDKWVIKAAPKPGGWTVNTPTIHRYVEIWVTGDIKLDDGGTVVLQQNVDGATGKVISDVSAVIYFDHNVKIGETKETKTNSGGFDNQSDDAKNLLLLGVTQPDSGKMPKDDYLDPLGNDAVYTPYKASGNVVFKENDFTGAIYAPDHNIDLEATADGRGKRKHRKQSGNDFYGSFVGRTIHNHKAHNFHFDESLNDYGPIKDWGYVSWFEDVDVDRR